MNIFVFTTGLWISYVLDYKNNFKNTIIKYFRQKIGLFYYFRISLTLCTIHKNKKGPVPIKQFLLNGDSRLMYIWRSRLVGAIFKIITFCTTRRVDVTPEWILWYNNYKWKMFNFSIWRTQWSIKISCKDNFYDIHLCNFEKKIVLRFDRNRELWNIFWLLRASGGFRRFLISFLFLIFLLRFLKLLLHGSRVGFRIIFHFLFKLGGHRIWSDMSDVSGLKNGLKLFNNRKDKPY